VDIRREFMERFRDDGPELGSLRSKYSVMSRTCSYAKGRGQEKGKNERVFLGMGSGK